MSTNNFMYHFKWFLFLIVMLCVFILGMLAVARWLDWMAKPDECTPTEIYTTDQIVQIAVRRGSHSGRVGSTPSIYVKDNHGFFFELHHYYNPAVDSLFQAHPNSPQAIGRWNLMDINRHILAMEGCFYRMPQSKREWERALRAYDLVLQESDARTGDAFYVVKTGRDLIGIANLPSQFHITYLKYSINNQIFEIGKPLSPPAPQLNRNTFSHEK